MKKITAILAILFLGSFLVLGSASAVQINFDNIDDIGTLSYDGEGGPLVGAGIFFDSIVGTGTPDNDTVELKIVDGILNFSTGNNISENVLGIWTFASGGSFVLTGSVYNGLNELFSGTILTGSFSGYAYAINTPFYLLFSGVGVDEKAQELTDFYGIEAPWGFNFANTVITGSAPTIGTNGGFRVVVKDADIVNTAAVPEPATMMLLGMGLLGLGAIGRKKLMK